MKSPSNAWFTEGFDTRVLKEGDLKEGDLKEGDLKEAKALLDELPGAHAGA